MYIDTCALQVDYIDYIDIDNNQLQTHIIQFFTDCHQLIEQLCCCINNDRTVSSSLLK